MGDYMFMLENHLSANQFRVVERMRDLAGEAGSNIFLTGGAMRDTLAGFPVRDLDFTVEGNALKLAKVAEKKLGAKLVSTDDHRKSAELLFPGGTTAEIAMARQERYTKSGARPQVIPATIHEDLRCRDFTVNAVALSLNKASLGLPIDPTNGIGDIERKELRTIHNYSFYDEPVRMLRLMRFKARLGFAIDDRTRAHFDNAREAEMLSRIASDALGDELRKMAEEPNAGDLMEALEQEQLIDLYSPALPGPKLNLAAFQKLQKARQMVQSGVEFRLHPLPLFLNVLLEKLNAKERADLLKTAGVTKAEVNASQKLDAVAKKLERDLKSAKLQKASQLYQVLMQAPGEAVLYLLLNSAQRLVLDRIKNYFQKHLPASLEITDEMVAATPGTPKFQKAKEQMILTRLDARPKKPAPAPEAVPAPPMSSFARGPSVRHAR
ncbi:MAG: CCA tRNA nucleotidyltransferase [Bryobacterales bacterium]|nr:CCA tRNA nucleotidyltransferase [Bryobacterales bacterium]